MTIINNEWQRRRATVKINRQVAIFNKIDEGVHTCHVLGLFQVQEDVDIQPYFICELYSGQCIYADPRQVCFTDTDERGTIIDG